MARNNSNSTFGCTLSIVPLIFVVVWSLGIQRYAYKETLDHAMQYAIVELAINATLLAVSLLGCCNVTLVLLGLVSIGYMIVNMVMLGLGFGWFKELTGYTIFEMYNQLGHNAWLQLPLIQGAMYFNLWLSLVLSCLSAFALAAQCLFVLCGFGSAVCRNDNLDLD